MFTSMVATFISFECFIGALDAIEEELGDFHAGNFVICTMGDKEWNGDHWIIQ